MQLNEIHYSDAQPISGYGAGFFRIGEDRIEGHAIVTATGAKGWGGLDDIDGLLAMKGEVDVILIGTGAEIAHLPAALRDALDDVGIGAEAMSSPSACRTYNVLVAEGRRVAAAVVAV